MSLNFKRLYYTNGSYADVSRFSIFKSYSTLIAVYDWRHQIMYKDKYYYSSSTSRQCNRWAREIIGVEPNDKNFKKNNTILCESEKIVELVGLIEKYGQELNINNDIMQQPKQ